MGFTMRYTSRSRVNTRILDWLYDNPDGATLVYRDGVLVESSGPGDYQELRALERSDDVVQVGFRPERFSKANSAGQEHRVTFRLKDRVRSAIRWERETPPALKAASQIEGIAAMGGFDAATRAELDKASAWLRGGRQG